MVKVVYGDAFFRCTISDSLGEYEYILDMPHTREKIVPEKCKHYIRKTTLYISLHKEKEGEWWTLKGV